MMGSHRSAPYLEVFDASHGQRAVTERPDQSGKPSNGHRPSTIINPATLERELVLNGYRTTMFVSTVVKP